MTTAFTNSEFGRPPSKMEGLLRGVADKLNRFDNKPGEGCRDMFERVLRESGLLRLLEAGQAMRDVPAWCTSQAGNQIQGLTHKETGAWDAGLAAMKEKIR